MVPTTPTKQEKEGRIKVYYDVLLYTHSEGIQYVSAQKVEKEK